MQVVVISGEKHLLVASKTSKKENQGDKVIDERLNQITESQNWTPSPLSKVHYIVYMHALILI